MAGSGRERRFFLNTRAEFSLVLPSCARPLSPHLLPLARHPSLSFIFSLMISLLDKKLSM